MTLAEIARQLNTSTMTVYRRLDKAGVKIADLRDADTGEITAEGVAVIGGLFTTTGATQPATDTIPERTEMKFAEKPILANRYVNGNDNGRATAFTQIELTLLLFFGSDSLTYL